MWPYNFGQSAKSFRLPEVFFFQISRVKTVKDLKKKLPILYQELQKSASYKEMYKRVYSLFLINSTTLDIDYALALWNYLLKDRFNFLKELQEYV